MMQWLCAAVVGITVAAAGTSPQAVATASLSGQVVNAADNAPIRRVTVTLTVADAIGNRVAVTDDQGRFAFAALPAGRFTLTASRLGYVTMSYGATRDWRSPGVPIMLRAGQQLSGIDLRLPKGGVITGRVTDPLGQPIEDLRIGVSQPRTLNGQLALAPVPVNGNAVTAFQATSTDDRGIFRLYGLPAGTFVVSAYKMDGDPLRTFEPTTSADLDWAKASAPLTGTSSAAPPAPAPAVGHVPIFFPGTPDASAATPITLSAGEERGGVDFQITPVRFATISGTVTAATGDPVPEVLLFAVRSDAAPGGLSGGIPPLGTSDTLGHFTIRGVPAGRFSVLAQSRGRAAPGSPALALFARTDVTVDGTDVAGLNLQLSPGVTVSGRVEAAGAPLPPQLLRTKVRIAAPPGPGASINVPPADVAADGSFKMDGVGPGVYVLSVTIPDGWMVKAASLGDRDLLAGPFEVAAGQPVTSIAVTLTDRLTEVSGRLLDQAGQPAPDYYVLVYPADRRLWTMGKDRLRAAVRPDATGRYRVAGLPPGDYYLAALADVQPNDYADPGFLEMLVPASVKLTLADGEKKTQDVKFAGG